MHDLSLLMLVVMVMRTWLVPYPMISQRHYDLISFEDVVFITSGIL